MHHNSFGSGNPSLDNQAGIPQYSVPTNVGHDTGNGPDIAYPFGQGSLIHEFQRTHPNYAEQWNPLAINTRRNHQVDPWFYHQASNQSTAQCTSDAPQACNDPQVLKGSRSHPGHPSATVSPASMSSFRNIMEQHRNQYASHDHSFQPMQSGQSTGVHRAHPQNFSVAGTHTDTFLSGSPMSNHISQDRREVPSLDHLMDGTSHHIDAPNHDIAVTNYGINEFSDPKALTQLPHQPSHEAQMYQGHDMADFRAPQPAPLRTRAPSKATSHPGTGQLPSRKCKEPKCPRNFRPTVVGQEFCGRHQKKWERNHAGPPHFYMDNKIGSFEAAKNEVYPWTNKLLLEGDDLETVRQHEHEWILKLLEAASKPYEGSSEFRIRQQKVYNGKEYNNLDVNVRIRFLYKAALTFHEGGTAVYARGGDNGGYGKADVTLKLSERLMRIIHHMEKNKRVCMDVIEGRGVIALVENPDKYEKRKRQNKKSNKKKQKAQRRGQDGAPVEDEHDGSDSDSDPSTDDDDSDQEEDPNFATLTTPGQPSNSDPGPSTANLAGEKRKRATRSRTANAKDPKRPKMSKPGESTPGTGFVEEFEKNDALDFGTSGIGGAPNHNSNWSYTAAVPPQTGDTSGRVTRSRTALDQKLTDVEIQEMIAEFNSHPPADVPLDLLLEDNTLTNLAVDPSMVHDSHMAIHQYIDGDLRHGTSLPLAEPRLNIDGQNVVEGSLGNGTTTFDPYRGGFVDSPDSDFNADPLDNLWQL